MPDPLVALAVAIVVIAALLILLVYREGR